MNTLARRVDSVQRRRRRLGFPLAVVYKFFDDQGSYLAVIVTYYAFVAIFPLLLISSSVLGFFLQGNEDLQKAVLESALKEFPIVGTQLATPQGLEGSTGAVIVGTLTAIYGIIGLGQAVQNAVNVTWGIPRNGRLNPFRGRLRSGALLTLAGVTVLSFATLTVLAGSQGSLPGGYAEGMGWLVSIGSVLVLTAMLTLCLRPGARPRPALRKILPGAFFTAVGWHLLERLGGIYVDHVLAKASEVNGVFALTLGLIGLIYAASVIAVIGAELNSVIAHRLYPRSLLALFTDSAVDLTPADHRAYAMYAQAQRHKSSETIAVTFEHRPGRGRKPDPEEPADS
ncbi:YihY/virulence factor BrkB family protein [Kribbella sp. CA-293567]|uniref:YihY/virulence factor BrkB family protein n=1 Tax=Kribbella sp. CA-293567 TaxID=3002436 RepID=UPI0022DE4007|nr:YihY/virulence factor BrkB family protein [Kribbella sp. CA-293567]WBQ04007.1 YihY/virulence factor BrkB family protein [Kribbella sp. CA-293567]